MNGLPYENEMQTLAEIAIAMAGFAGIVSALRKAESGQGIDYARFRELLLTAFSVVFFAFLPKLVSGVSSSTVWIWQMPQLVLGLLHASLMILFLRTAGAATIRNALRRPRSAVDYVERATLFGGLMVVVIQLGTGLGLFAQHLPTAYLLALLWFLFVAATNFIALLLPSDEG